MIIYVDILLVINFAINFVLLRITSLLVRKPSTLGRISLAAALGALGALSLFINLSFWSLLTFRVLLTALMTASAFKAKNLFEFITAAACLFCASFLLSGILLLWQSLTAPRGVMSRNGALYLSISAPMLLICCAVSYMAASFLSALMSQGKSKENFCRATICCEGGCCAVTALIDSGSSLCEPFSNCPVMVCEQRAVEAVTPKAVKSFVRYGTAQEDFGQNGLRLVSYRTIDSEGLLPAFLPREMYLSFEGGKTVKANDCYIAVLPGAIGGSGYAAVINPAAIPRIHTGS